MAADHTSLAVLAGSTITAGAAYMGTRKGRSSQRSEEQVAAAELVKAASELATSTLSELQGLRDEIAKLKVAIEACEAKHSTAQQELARLRQQLA